MPSFPHPHVRSHDFMLLGSRQTPPFIALGREVKAQAKMAPRDC